MEDAARVANLLLTIGGTDVRSFPSGSDSHRVICDRRGEEWTFAARHRGDSRYYVLAVGSRYLLTGSSLEEITVELEEIVANRQHTLQRNAGAHRMSVL